MLPGWPRVRARRVSRGTWLVGAAGHPREVHRLGRARLGAAVIYDRGSAARHPAMLQKAGAAFLRDQHISWLLRELRVNCVLDVGANVGQYATALRRLGYRGRIVSFEPVPALAERLRDASRRDPEWHVHECALGEDEGTAEINVVPGTMSSLLGTSEFGRRWAKGLRRPERQGIQVRRLQDLYAEVTAGLGERRVYLKLDTQGFDLAAFRGAGGQVRELLGLQSEVSLVPIYEGMPRLPEQLAAYEAAGFETTGLFEVSRDRRTMRVIELDLVMLGPAGLQALPDGAARPSATRVRPTRVLE